MGDSAGLFGKSLPDGLSCDVRVHLATEQAIARLRISAMQADIQRRNDLYALTRTFLRQIYKLLDNEIDRRGMKDLLCDIAERIGETG